MTSIARSREELDAARNLVDSGFPDALPHHRSQGDRVIPVLATLG